MQIYLIRHGLAGERGTYEDDRERPLTAKGQSKTKAVAQQLKAFGLSFDEILTSPLVRARQTADILLQADLAPHLSTTDALAPLGSFSSWLEWLQAWRQGDSDSLALVGHEPDLSQWAELLVWGEVRGALQLKKAGIIGIEIPDNVDPLGNSILFWLTPPRLFVLS
ncbi:phosphohistidine phosphatase SixA [Altericista sp. CCNU0014]|uniref:phosphohistidine phosphatase SixA n=1 Tax=Altericista sp. CCNU0014 TaxID=3082949 RepID=UPI0038504405